MLETYEDLLELIHNNANDSADIKLIREDTNLIEELQYDSITLIQLIADIEDEFGISLSNDDLLADKIDTPANLWEIVKKHKINE